MEAILTILIAAIGVAVLLFVCMVIMILLNPVKEIEWVTDEDLIDSTEYPDDEEIRLN